MPEVDARLTSRELAALAAVSKGKTNEEIATEWYVSESTVKTHLRNAHAKLKARSRAHAVALAIRAGLI